MKNSPVTSIDDFTTSASLLQFDNSDTHPSNVSDRLDFDIAFAIDSVCFPAIIALGLTGNVLGAASLLRVAGLRRRGIGHLMVAICVSDALFLVSVLPVWIGSRYGSEFDLFNSDGWCQLLSLTTMCSNFLSTWFTVALAVERYLSARNSSRLRVMNSLRINSQTDRSNTKQFTSLACGPSKTRITILALTVLAIVVFVNLVVNIGVTKSDNVDVPRCVPLKPAVDAMHFLTNVDLVVNVILPNFTIVGLYAAVCIRLVAWRFRRRRVICRQTPRKPTESGTGARTAVLPADVRLTKTAVLLSAVVVLLTAPSHVERTAHAASEAFELPVPPLISGGAAQVVVRELFHASFAVPFYVVVVSHRRIRRSITLSMQLAVASRWKRLQKGKHHL